MFTPSKSADPFDLTIMGTPQPQATSTVQRKSTLEARYGDFDAERLSHRTSSVHKDDDVMQKSQDSSLGILDNISSFLAEVSTTSDDDKTDQNKFDVERELARKLLRKCSDFNMKFTAHANEANKENNINIQNLADTGTAKGHSEAAPPFHSNSSTFQNDSTSEMQKNKASAGSVIFEPNEITARSSGLSRSSEKCLSNTSNKNSNAISFDSTTAEIMAQFGNEEFRPASEMASQMLADEASWQQNYSYALPTATVPEKEYLDLSCFSGIIGELDLSVESCAGRKVSIDEFFRRKCGNIGDLSGDATSRPSLGLSIGSPKKRGQPIPLIDSTITTEASSVASSNQKDTTQPVTFNVTKDIEEQSIMSLSSIAQALQDIDNGTPRRLVDQLIMAKKKKKPMQLQEDGLKGTTFNVLPNTRQSMPATPTVEKCERDSGLAKISTKFSLDSKQIDETINPKEKTSRMLSFDSVSSIPKESTGNEAQESLKKEAMSTASSSSQKIDLRSFMGDHTILAHNNTNTNIKQQISMLENTQTLREKENVNIQTQQADLQMGLKEENISYKSKSDTITYENSAFLDQSPLTKGVVIGRSTDELCNCIVGIPRETDLELMNKTDRWIICNLSLQQIQGDKQSIILTLPSDVILIKPNIVQCVKIGVKVIKLCKPIIVVVNITVSDMVTRLESIMKHIICFKPEELNIQVSGLSEKNELDFECIVENSVVVAPIRIENKNSTEIPLKLSLLQDKPTVFSFDGEEEQRRIIVKPQDSILVNLECKGILYQNENEIQQKRVCRYEARLIVQAECDANDAITVKEASLAVQVGTCKIQIVHTELPLVILPNKTKSLSVVNLGATPISITASLTQDPDTSQPARNFDVEPQDLILECEKTASFFISYKTQASDTSKKYCKLKLSVGSNAYYYSIIGEGNNPEGENAHFMRCETPQYLGSMSSPNSPHSAMSNRSGLSGRHSPGSCASGSTVAGDKIPIRATHAALVWNSVRTGKSDIKEFTIRNTSNNKVKIQAVILDDEKSFRFLRERQAIGTSLVLVLQRAESRSLSVVFSPHHVGAVRGKIIFRHYEPKRENQLSRPTKLVLLCGYGGFGKVDISEVFKDISGKMWLSLGTFNDGGYLNARIKLQNTGDLPSFIKIKLTPKAMYPTMLSSWQISPTELILNPRETQWMSLEFRPRKDDLISLQRSDVSHVGTLTIIHGDEPTRLRIRRLYNKLKETSELDGSEKEIFRDMVHLICTAFPGEMLLPDLTNICDSVQNLGELCQGIRQHEVMLTMETSADETLSVLHDSVDDSQMFYSLCSDNSHIYESAGESFLPSESMGGHEIFQSELGDNNFVVSPSVIVLNPPIRTVGIVTIQSSCRVAQPFETSLSNTEYLSVMPAEGMIPTRRDFQLKIQCRQKIERNFNAILEIYTENNKQDVEIRSEQLHYLEGQCYDDEG